MKSFLAACLCLLLGVSACLGQVGDLHNAAVEFSGLNNPNGPWSYHVGQAFGNPQQPYNTLSVQGAPGDNTWEAPAVPSGAPFHRISLGTSQALGSHSPFMTRWTVPAGVVAVEACLSYHQTWEPTRHMRMFIKYNGVDIATMNSIQPLDNTGSTGVWTRFFPDDNEGFKFSVVQGDTIDFVVDAYGPQSQNPGVGSSSSFISWVREIAPLTPPNAQLTINTNPSTVSTVLPYANNTLAQISGYPINIRAYPMVDCPNNTKYIFDHWVVNSNAQIANTNDAITTVTILQPGSAQITAYYTTTQTSFTDCGAIDVSNLNCVIVSPQGPGDGGDFGPGTPGTQTAGFQEAFEYAINKGKKEVFIVGGPGITYNIEKQLIVPPAENLHINGGNYMMSFSQTTGDCLVIDGQAQNRYRFGIVSAPNLTNGSLVRLDPSGSGAFENCNIEIYAITAQTNPGNSVTGLILNGPNDCKVKVNSIEGCNTGVHLVSGDNNTVTCTSIRSCDTMLFVEAGRHCEIDASFTAGVRPNAVGADIAGGSNNLYRLVWMDEFDPSSGLVLGVQANDNIIKVMNLPLNAIVQTSNPATNRIIALKSYGFELTTPAVPTSGQYAVNNTGFGIVAMIVNAGTVSSWSVKDTSGTINTVSTGLYAGQSIMLEPGESVGFTYTSAPAWRWRILK